MRKSLISFQRSTDEKVINWINFDRINLETEKTELQNQKHQLEFDRAALQSEKTQLESDNANLTSERDVLKTANSNLNGEISALTSEKIQLESVNNNLTSANNLLTDQVNILESDKSKLESENLTLATNVTNLTNERDTLKTSNTNLFNQVTQLESDKNKLQSEKTQLESDKITLQSEKSALQADINSKSNIIQEVKNTCNNYTNIISDKSSLSSILLYLIDSAFYQSASSFKQGSEDRINSDMEIIKILLDNISYKASRIGKQDFQMSNVKITITDDLIKKSKSSISFNVVNKDIILLPSLYNMVEINYAEFMQSCGNVYLGIDYIPSYDFYIANHIRDFTHSLNGNIRNDYFQQHLYSLWSKNSSSKFLKNLDIQSYSVLALYSYLKYLDRYHSMYKTNSSSEPYNPEITTEPYNPEITAYKENPDISNPDMSSYDSTFADIIKNDNISEVISTLLQWALPDTAINARILINNEKIISDVKNKLN